ncbi:DinB family protein [Micromonospora sp. NPDC000207]|uniref:DinB family protein n=1 Tax=Micromonospora sp. NPDC000207 TaxID=3154246 RepID=UPI0033209633
MANPIDPADVFTLDPHVTLTADERTQLTAFLDAHRRLLNQCLDGLTEEEARRRLVPSRTTLLGLVKHVTYVERVWFGEAVTGVSRVRMGLPAKVDDSYLFDDTDTIAAVREAHRAACASSVAALADLDLDAVVTGHRLGPMAVRWILHHVLRELAHHCGHADILREQIIAARSS